MMFPTDAATITVRKSLGICGAMSVLLLYRASWLRKARLYKNPPSETPPLHFFTRPVLTTGAKAKTLHRRKPLLYKTFDVNDGRPLLDNKGFSCAVFIAAQYSRSVPDGMPAARRSRATCCRLLSCGARQCRWSYLH